MYKTKIMLRLRPIRDNGQYEMPRLDYDQKDTNRKTKLGQRQRPDHVIKQRNIQTKICPGTRLEQKPITIIMKFETKTTQRLDQQ